MARHPRFCPRPGRALAIAGALALMLTAGCMSVFHPIQPPAPHKVAACRMAPDCARNHVYIFMVHGLDPFDYANLSGLCDYFHHLGFRKVYYGQLYHTHDFEDEIDRLHREDPQARFVLVGFSFGANMVRYLANSANDEHIPIDLLVYLGGNTLKNEPRDQPPNVARVINILASGCIWNGAWLDRAENVHVRDVFHFGSPSHPYTLDVLAREMAVVASNVPVSLPPLEGPLPPGVTLPSPGPTTSAARGEWDFLKPVSRLGPLPPSARPAPGSLTVIGH